MNKMDSTENYTLANLLKDRSMWLFTCFSISFTIFSFITIGTFFAIVILASSLTGVLVPFIVFKDRKHLPNLLALFIGSNDISGEKEMVRSCSVCGGERCSRQHPSTVNSTTAHAHVNFTVPKSIDKALDELLSEVLDNHVYSWYHEISVHDQLADEIRFIIRYASASLGTRLMKVDLTAVIVKKLIPLLVSHLDVYVEGGRQMRGNTSLESAVIAYLKNGNSLHKALQSRNDESLYLKAVVSSLLPHLLPSKYLTSNISKSFLEDLIGHFLLMQGMDLLATPDTVNLLFLLLLESRHEPSINTKDEDELEVLLLKNFASVNTHPRNSVLRNNLSAILNDKGLLYLFQNFLKEEGAINLLQFCLAVEDFNHQILNPDLTEDQLEFLHKEALELYHNYMVPTAVDRVNFPADIVAEIRIIVHGKVSEIVKLRTTRPLFQAYEHTYNLLEREYLPLFMNCSAYIGHLCGSRSPQPYHHRSSSSGSPGRSREVNELTAKPSVGKVVVKKVGIGLKQIGKQMVFKPSVIIGDDARSYFDIDEASDISFLMAEDGSSMSTTSGLEGLTSSSFRDLSAWRVTIPRVEQRVDEAGKGDLVFIVDVTRIDVARENADDLHWEVERRYHEFYILEAKLTEFHGGFHDNQLPPRRSLLSSKGMEFMSSRRLDFEEFLQKLLQKPSLKGSQLLFLFLKSQDEFTTSFLPDVSIGRMIRDVPRKLIKERGQHLDAFITTFLNSTANPMKAKANLEVEDGTLPDEHEEKPKESINDILSTIFQDNAKSLQSPVLSPNPSPIASININGIVDTIFYIAIRIYSLSLSTFRWIHCIRVLAGSTTDAAITWFLQRKLKQALQPSKIVKIIKLLQDALFNDLEPPRTKKDVRLRENRLREELISLVPYWVQKVLFETDNYIEGANTLVNLFQHPILNKQLSYVLLDMVIDELFPELNLEEINSAFLTNLQTNKVA